MMNFNDILTRNKYLILLVAADLATRTMTVFAWLTTHHLRCRVVSPAHPFFYSQVSGDQRDPILNSLSFSISPKPQPTQEIP